MNIDNEFKVSLPIEQAWEVLTDLERIAPCMPGAQLTGSDGDTYSGKVKVRVGPVTTEYAGTATFVERDGSAYRAVISAKGREAKGTGNASATITAQLRPDEDNTVVSVVTDLKISGKVAQFGSSVIAEVSEKLMGQFVDSLGTMLASQGQGNPGLAGGEPGEGAGAEPGEGAGAYVDGPASGPEQIDGEQVGREQVGREQVGREQVGREQVEGTARRQPLRVVPPASEPEAIDLMKLAGSSVAKRVVPVVLGAVVLGVVIYLIARS